MRFSYWPAPTQPFKEVCELANAAADQGFEGVWYADHFMPDGKETSAPWSEAWTTLSALAIAVPKLRLGPLVSGNTYRHPAILAKMAATLDHISEGRVVLGLGAGWQLNEHEQYGLEFGTIPTRLERLDEACQVIKALYTDEKSNFRGKYYQLDNASLEPKPVQPRLPLMIGGGGEKVTLKIVAKYADEWNTWGTVDTLKQKMAILDKHCADVGRNPSEIQRSAVALVFASDDSSFLKKMKSNKALRASLIGTPDEVAETMQAYADAGVQEFILPGFNLGPADNVRATLEMFSKTIISQIR